MENIRGGMQIVIFAAAEQLAVAGGRGGGGHLDGVSFPENAYFS